MGNGSTVCFFFFKEIKQNWLPAFKQAMDGWLCKWLSPYNYENFKILILAILCHVTLISNLAE